MTCNSSTKLLGGKRGKSQQRRQVSQRRRVGGDDTQVIPEEKTEVPVPAEVQEKEPVNEVVSEVVKGTEAVLANTTATTEEKPPVTTEASTDAATATTEVKSPSKEGFLGLGDLFGFGGKRRTQRRQRRQRKSQRAGSSKKTVLGRIYSKTCVHCIAMEKAWKQLEQMIKQRGGNVALLNVEASQMDQLPKLNQQLFGGSGQRVELQGGFPTLFKIKEGKVEYYGGERTAEAMYSWSQQ
jgi:hypothetical protein